MVTPLPVRTSWESEAAFSTTELPNPLPFTAATTGNTSLRYNFFKAEYEDLVLSPDLSIEKTLDCWWEILSCIETENSRISRRYIAKTGILSLEYILSSSAHVPETVSTSQCLLMIKLNQHPQWKVSESSIHPMIWKAVSESVDGYIHGVLACGPQFILFQVYRNGEIHYLIGNDEAPQDFRELLNNAVVRERLEGYMNGIAHKDLISLVQGHGEIFRAKDASTSTIVSHSSTKDSDTIQCEEEDTADSHVSNTAGPVVGKDHIHWVLGPSFR